VTWGLKAVVAERIDGPFLGNDAVNTFPRQETPTQEEKDVLFYMRSTPGVKGIDCVLHSQMSCARLAQISLAVCGGRKVPARVGVNSRKSQCLFRKATPFFLAFPKHANHVETKMNFVTVPYWALNQVKMCRTGPAAIYSTWPPLWSSGHSCWLQTQRSGFDCGRYQIFWQVVGLERGPASLVSTNEELLGRKRSGSGLEIREYGQRDPSRWPRGTLYP
jgi:hypothetical protein